MTRQRQSLSTKKRILILIPTILAYAAMGFLGWIYLGRDQFFILLFLLILLGNLWEYLAAAVRFLRGRAGGVASGGNRQDESHQQQTGDRRLRMPDRSSSELDSVRGGVALGWRQLTFLAFAVVAFAASFPLTVWTIRRMGGADLGPLLVPLVILIWSVYGGTLIAVPFRRLQPWLIRERVGKLLKRARRHIAAGRVDRLDVLLAKAKSLDKECGGCASEQIRQLEAELYLHVRNA